MIYLIIIIIVLSIVRVIYKYKSLTKTVDRLNKILYSDRNPEKYVEECDILLNKKFQGKRDRDMNLLQKSTGLFYAGKFEEAKNVLNVEITQIPAGGQHIFYQNLVLSMLFGGEIEKGHKILLDAKEVLDNFKRTGSNNDGIEFIFAVDDLYQGKYNERKEFFQRIAEEGRNYYRKAMANYCLSIIYKQEDNINEMNKCLNLAKELGQNSFVEKLVDGEMEQ